MADRLVEGDGKELKIGLEGDWVTDGLVGGGGLLGSSKIKKDYLLV